MTILTIRAEHPDDIPAIHALNVAAFGRAAEAQLVDRLRGTPFTTSWVAVQGLLPAAPIVGHLCFSPVAIAQTPAQSPLVLGLAPVAVAPDRQRQGIGTALIRQGLGECDRAGCGAIVVLGDPAYYHRFGFVPAAQFHLQCEYDVPAEAFMALELQPGAFAGCSGIVSYQAAFRDCT